MKNLSSITRTFTLYNGVTVLLRVSPHPIMSSQRRGAKVLGWRTDGDGADTKAAGSMSVNLLVKDSHDITLWHTEWMQDAKSEPVIKALRALKAGDVEIQNVINLLRDMRSKMDTEVLAANLQRDLATA